MAVDEKAKVINIVHEHKPITFSWENVNVFTPSSKDGIMGKVLFCNKEIPSKHIVKNGNRFLVFNQKNK
jgi:hypothetical protein